MLLLFSLPTDMLLSWYYIQMQNVQMLRVSEHISSIVSILPMLLFTNVAFRERNGQFYQIAQSN